MDSPHIARDKPDALRLLEDGPVYRFHDWPNALLPEVAAGVYTIWREEALIYAGMAGRGFTAEIISGHRAAKVRNKGLRSRLESHWSGRRSGDQFCVYVADRLVLSTLSSEQITAIAAGELKLDALVRMYVHAHLTYRFCELPDSKSAEALEREVRQAALGAGAPFLNPLRR